MEIYLREALKEDICDLYKYLNREYIKKYSKEEKIEWFKHKEWYKKIIKSENHKLLLINDEKYNFLGLIRYDLSRETKEALVSVFILIENRGRGLAKLALSKSFKHIKSENIKFIIAEVLIENENSIQLFNNLGFIEIDKNEDNYIFKKKL